ncbi:MAG: hypothetical protein WCL60_10625, partial [Methylococcales bacterium]
DTKIRQSSSCLSRIKLIAGAKSIEGKAVSSRNAFKGGLRPRFRKISALLKAQRKCMKQIK